MEKVEIIKAQDLVNLQQNETGDFLVPNEYVIYRKDKPVDRVAELEIQLESMQEPTDAELIEMGRSMHPYYMLVQELEMLKNINK